MTSPAELLDRIRNSERGQFMTIVIAVVSSAAWLSWMMYRAWFNTVGLNPVNKYAQTMGLTPLDVGAVLVGVYLGMTVLLLFDELRQTQGILLMAGGIVALVGMLAVSAQTGQLAGFEMRLAPVAGAGVGLIAGFAFGGGAKIFGDSDSELKFPRANLGIVVFVALGLLIVFVESLVDYQPLLGGEVTLAEAISNPILGFFDGVAVVVFVYSMYRFVGYEARSDIVVLGPGRVGKTHFMIGLFHQLRNTIGIRHSTNVEGPLGTLYDEEAWLVTNDVGDIEEMEFTYLDGRMPRQLRTVSLLDYAGQVFKYIPRALDPNVGKSNLSSQIGQPESSSEESPDAEQHLGDEVSTDGGSPEWARDPDESEDETTSTTIDTSDSDGEETTKGGGITDDLFGATPTDTGVIDQIEKAEIVLLIVDLERLRGDFGNDSSENSSTADLPWTSDDGPWFEEEDESADEDEDDVESLEITPYQETVEQLSNSKDVILVGTKADKYADTYPYPPEGNYDQFKQDVTQDFRHHGSVRGLLTNEIVDDSVYPVFIREDPNTGEPDFGGQREKRLQTFGFEQLIDVIERKS